tara:strand:+ start:126 stop:557 length:432 start_codon:yes stop_codon:yes gene_type:complete
VVFLFRGIMEHPWVFYFLFFIFGYSTCNTFYFLKSIRKSIELLRVSQVVSLFIIARSLEDFAYAKEYSILRMKEGEETESNIIAFEQRHQKEVDFFKENSIKSIINAHGNYFSEIVDYDDWNGAMKFLNMNKKKVFEFLTKKG